jgi:hypothetical protein
MMSTITERVNCPSNTRMIMHCKKHVLRPVRVTSPLLSDCKKRRMWQRINLLKPTGNYTYHKFGHSKILHCYHMEFVCFVWISEQTANFALCNIKRLVFITEVENVYCAIRTESLYNRDKSRL